MAASAARIGDEPPIVLSGRDFRFDPVTGVRDCANSLATLRRLVSPLYLQRVDPLVQVVLPQQAAAEPYLACRASGLPRA